MIFKYMLLTFLDLSFSYCNTSQLKYLIFFQRKVHVHSPWMSPTCSVHLNST